MIYSRIITALAVVFALAGCAGDDRVEVTVENTETITHYAQFRDPEQNRVAIFVFEEGISSVDIKHHAQSLAHKEERLLAAYYFPEQGIDLPPARLSRSGHIVRANDLMYEDDDVSSWHYAFLRPFAGEPRFADCLEAPMDVLCRQK